MGVPALAAPQDGLNPSTDEVEDPAPAGQGPGVEGQDALGEVYGVGLRPSPGHRPARRLVALRRRDGRTVAEGRVGRQGPLVAAPAADDEVGVVQVSLLQPSVQVGASISGARCPKSLLPVQISPVKV